MTLAPIAVNKEHRKADGVGRGEMETDVGCGPNAGSASALDCTVKSPTASPVRVRGVVEVGQNRWNVRIFFQ